MKIKIIEKASMYIITCPFCNNYNIINKYKKVGNLNIRKPLPTILFCKNCKNQII